ncbi:Maf family protein [Agaribacterium haliotis]|uniref:Maf family protein n=1 Tax=Agaribacterium haliotis TaxID=2013869 RepID=UPI0013040C2A|nr:Maf family nucleotide pyrophosphatase [Agaribacterium haliotis]
MPKLILASASRYKKQQLQQLGLSFETMNPDIDETPLAGESALAQSLRLAKAKAKKIASKNPHSYVLGCDQSASIEGHILCKPGSPEKAKQQLQQSSGKELSFFSGIALCNLQHDIEFVASCETVVRFRQLNEEEIDNYIKKEPATDCVGAFKVEAMGIQLFDYVRSDDPSALVGLPLIKTAQLLRQAGINPLDTHD